MRGAIRTAGDLRSVLCDAITGVRDGTMDLAKADKIAKLAGQVSASLTAEAQAALVNMKVTGGKSVIGQLPIGDPSSPAPALIDARPTPKRVAWVDGHAWCEQCDMRVSATQATGCKSKFCPVREQVPA